MIAGERDGHDRPDDDLAVGTAGLGVIAPTARIAACGGFITAVKLVMPNMPRLETVNVPAAAPAA